MSTTYIDWLPPELFALIAEDLSLPSLNAFVTSNRRIHEILQPTLDRYLRPEMVPNLLLWAAFGSKPHILSKLLAPPHSTDPNTRIKQKKYDSQTPLHAAAEAGSLEVAQLLLKAGADPAAIRFDHDYLRVGSYQPIHLAVYNEDYAMMELLLRYGAPIDALGGHLFHKTPLQFACTSGKLRLVQFLLDHGANVESSHDGYAAPLVCALRADPPQPQVVKLLLERGANPNMVAGGAPVLYEMLDLWPSNTSWSFQKALALKKWTGLPLKDAQCANMALLLHYKASKDAVTEHLHNSLDFLVERSGRDTQKIKSIVRQMLNDAEAAIPNILYSLRHI
ncbi:Ankyrin repeat domain protein [Mycena indigotica]|uniref:Ankyrin repeat domain protein n=1 Tax=Mycena indigotica TaxID=2126181 RepID=A0A8H6T112_9AGAR|nr:Ankyrin repeat domain protein [Mycena indigotica]KAF7310010.1 Ankyrin repeat domain protein [Mycena indigotica]